MQERTDNHLKQHLANIQQRVFDIPGSSVKKEESMIAICAPFPLFLRAMAVCASVFLIKGKSSSALCSFLRSGHFVLILRMYPDFCSFQSSPDAPTASRPAAQMLHSCPHRQVLSLKCSLVFTKFLVTSFKLSLVYHSKRFQGKNM